MENLRSMSCKEGRFQMDGNNGAPTSMQDLRSYSVNNAVPTQLGKEMKIKKGKPNLGSSSSVKRSWSFNDPEMQRKRRVASYKVYTIEGKMKGSIRKSFRWIKEVVYGWR